MERVLKQSDAIAAIAKKYCEANSFLFLARQINFPIALEGALKLKEISYIHAEGYPAAEMKHGPIVLSIRARHRSSSARRTRSTRKSWPTSRK